MGRAARLFLALVLSLSLPAMSWAREFITEVKLIGADTRSALQENLNWYKEQGWKVIDYDLNRGCGSKSDFICLIYRKDFNNENPDISYITRFKIKVGKDYPDYFKIGMTTYHLVPYAGTSHFCDMKGDLNSNCGGEYIHLYYTREFFGDFSAVTGIYFNSDGSGSDHLLVDAGSNCDLNKGVKNSPYIWMHLNLASKFSVGTTYDLSTVNQDLLLRDKDTATGTLASPVKVSVADCAEVTLRDVIISTSNAQSQWAGITCEGDANINIEGSNQIHGCSAGYPGIYVPEEHVLEISGDGKLQAYSGGGADEGRAAGIGGGENLSCGAVGILGGEVEAIGGKYAAGIGTGSSRMGYVTINGGDITAIGGSYAPGIGASRAGCGDISITGGTVFATSGAEGICSYCTGLLSAYSNITIGDDINVVVATRGSADYLFLNTGDEGTLSIGSSVTRQEEGNTCTLMGLSFDPDGIRDIKDEELEDEGTVYNLAGQRLNKMQKGINIIGGRKVLK